MHFDHSPPLPTFEIHNELGSAFLNWSDLGPVILKWAKKIESITICLFPRIFSTINGKLLEIVKANHDKNSTRLLETLSTVLYFHIVPTFKC